MATQDENGFLFEGASGVLRGHPPGVAMGFSTRAAHPEGMSARDGARSLAEALGAAHAELATLKQVHGRHALILEEKPVSGRLVLAGEGDALATREPGRLLIVQSADCVPILLADPVTGWIAALHAGWRGTALRILDALLDALEERGVEAGNLFAAFGPSISRDRYEVGPEVIGQMTDAYVDVPVDSSAVCSGPGDRSLLDVAAFNRALLLHRGVFPAHVVATGLCTFDRKDLFPSYRRDGPGTGRILTGIVRH